MTEWTFVLYHLCLVTSWISWLPSQDLESTPSASGKLSVWVMDLTLPDYIAPHHSHFTLPYLALGWWMVSWKVQHLTKFWWSLRISDFVDWVFFWTVNVLGCSWSWIFSNQILVSQQISYLPSDSSLPCLTSPYLTCTSGCRLVERSDSRTYICVRRLVNTWQSP